LKCGEEASCENCKRHVELAEGVYDLCTWYGTNGAQIPKDKLKEFAKECEGFEPKDK